MRIILAESSPSAVIAAVPFKSYSVGSSRLSPVHQSDWTSHTAARSIFVLIMYIALWFGCIKFFGLSGMRVSAFITSFTLLNFVVVPLVTQDVYELTINFYWTISM